MAPLFWSNWCQKRLLHAYLKLKKDFEYDDRSLQDWKQELVTFIVGIQPQEIDFMDISHYYIKLLSRK